MPIPNLNNIPVLVTGGAGFIGSHLVDGLVEHGAHVTVLDNLSAGHMENLESYFDSEQQKIISTSASKAAKPLAFESRVHPVTFIFGDIRNLDTCRQACDGKAFVFHQAAMGSVPRSMEDPAATMNVNVMGTTNVFTVARDAKVKRVVFASSSSVYGDSETLPKKEGNEGKPLSPYALSKSINEEMADLFVRNFNMEIVGLRYFNVYGPRQNPDGPYAAVIPRFFKAYLLGKAPVIYGDGQQTRDFTFVKDVVEANLLVAGANGKIFGRAFNIAKGTPTTINKLAQCVRDATNGTATPLNLDSRRGDIRHSTANPALAKDMMKFKARTQLCDGLNQGLGFYSGLFT